MPELITIPEARQGGLRELADALAGASHVVLTTHVNADGDGAGSQAALAGWLMAKGVQVSILNPTPFPASYAHLVAPEVIADPGSERADWATSRADLFLVVDTSEPRRIGRIAKVLEGRRVGLIDHHPPDGESLGDFGVRDPSAAATGELVYDLLVLADGADADWPDLVAEAIYTAIVSDTGSFRFANTNPRTHLIAADLLRRGVDPEAVYRRLYATMPLRRIRLLQAALEELEVDPELPISWITVPRAVVEELSADAEDLDGIIEYPRGIQGTEVAVLFRETPDGGTKISFRSNGPVDVNRLARAFGGGGHVKASGALIGSPLDEAREAVLEAVRQAVRELENRSGMR